MLINRFRNQSVIYMTSQQFLTKLLFSTQNPENSLSILRNQEKDFSSNLSRIIRTARHKKEVSKRKNNKLKTIKSINSLTDGSTSLFSLTQASLPRARNYLFVAWSIKWPVYACERALHVKKVLVFSVASDIISNTLSRITMKTRNIVMAYHIIYRINR